MLKVKSLVKNTGIMKTSALVSASFLLSMSLLSNAYGVDYELFTPSSENDTIGNIADSLEKPLERALNEDVEVNYINYGSPQEAYKLAFNNLDVRHTLTLITTPRFSSFIVSQRSTYDMDSFYYYGGLFSSTSVIVANKEHFITKLDDLTKYCRKYPLNISLNGIGGVGFLAMSEMNKKYKCEVQYLPDKKYLKQLATLKAGNADISIIPLYVLLPILKKQQQLILKNRQDNLHKKAEDKKELDTSKFLRAVAVIGDEKAEGLPHVETTKEVGFSQIEGKSYVGIAGLSSVSKDFVLKMQHAIDRALSSKDFHENMKRRGLTINRMSGRAFYNKIQQQQKNIKQKYNDHPW